MKNPVRKKIKLIAIDLDGSLLTSQNTITDRTLGTFPEGALRVSPGPFNEEEDIEFFLNALSELVKDSGE